MHSRFSLYFLFRIQIESQNLSYSSFIIVFSVARDARNRKRNRFRCALSSRLLQIARVTKRSLLWTPITENDAARLRIGITAAILRALA